MSQPSSPTIPPNQHDANGMMTITWQACMILTWMDFWAKSKGGYAKVLASPKHLWEELYQMQDNTPRILICFNGEKSRGPFTQANKLHRVDRQWLVCIVRGHGFNNLMAQGQGKPGTPGYIDPFYQDCETIRDQLRILINITEELPIDYQGMEPIPSISPYGNTGNVFIDGYAVKFSTANDIMAVTNIQPQ